MNKSQHNLFHFLCVNIPGHELLKDRMKYACTDDTRIHCTNTVDILNSFPSDARFHLHVTNRDHVSKTCPVLNEKEFINIINSKQLENQSITSDTFTLNDLLHTVTQVIEQNTYSRLKVESVTPLTLNRDWSIPGGYIESHFKFTTSSGFGEFVESYLNTNFLPFGVSYKANCQNEFHVSVRGVSSLEVFHSIDLLHNALGGMIPDYTPTKPHLEYVIFDTNEHLDSSWLPILQSGTFPLFNICLQNFIKAYHNSVN